jgi:uncharacterized damage-inducible protein DinB
MIYHSLTEIYDAKSSALNKIQQRVQGLTTAQANFHPSSGGWSVADNVEHLCLVEAQLLQLIGSLLKKTEEAGKTHSPNAPFEISVQAAYEKSKTEKYKTRDATVPTGKKAMQESLQTLQDYQSQLQNLQPRLQSVDLAFASFSHWIFGSLGLGQWLAFITLHEERHLGQIDSIIASSGFPLTDR